MLAALLLAPLLLFRGNTAMVEDVYLVDDRPVDVRVDGESVFPTWFKVEFKENGEVSAKVKGVKLSSKRGDTIRIHLGPP